jgi:hypothetical protein
MIIIATIVFRDKSSKMLLGLQLKTWNHKMKTHSVIQDLKFSFKRFAFIQYNFADLVKSSLLYVIDCNNFMYYI